MNRTQIRKIYYDMRSYTGKILSRHFSVTEVKTDDGYIMSYPTICALRHITVDRRDDESRSSANMRLIDMIAANYSPKPTGLMQWDWTPNVNAEDFRAMIHSSENVFYVRVSDVPQKWTPPMSTRENISELILNAVRQHDRERYHKMGCVNYHDHCITPYDYWGTRMRYETNIPSLAQLCYRHFSLYNNAYGGTKDGSYVVNGAYNPMGVLMRSIPKLMKTHITFNAPYRFEDTFRATNFYYKNCVRLKTHRWTLHKADFSLLSPNNSKHGWYRGNSSVYKHTPDEVIKFVTNPDKHAAHNIAMVNIYHIVLKGIEATRDGVVPVEKGHSLGVTTLAFKHQYTNQYADSLGSGEVENPKDYQDKGRIFYLSQDRLFHSLFKFRHSERSYYPKFWMVGGKKSRTVPVRIDIGTKWIKGGAMLRFLSLRGDEGDVYEKEVLYDSRYGYYIHYKFVKQGKMEFGEFDISGLDLAILAPMLCYYMMCARYWIVPEDTHQYRLFQYLLEVGAELLSGKTVRWLDGFLMIIGMMPSGSAETSHGNSWILAVFGFLTFIFYAISVCPSRSGEIIHALMNGYLLCGFFGDDCLYANLAELSDVVGIKIFGEFLMTMYRMKTRNLFTSRSLLTFVDWNVQFGAFRTTVRGPRYLKRYMVRSDNFGHDEKTVLAWRPTLDYEWRSCIPGHPSDHPVLILARVIGLAYDSMGVCEYTYNYLLTHYNILLLNLSSVYPVKQIEGLILDELKNNDKEMKYAFKVGHEEIPTKFPSLKTLRDFNTMDRNAHLPPYRPNWQAWASAPDVRF